MNIPLPRFHLPLATHVPPSPVELGPLHLAVMDRSPLSMGNLPRLDACYRQNVGLFAPSRRDAWKPLLDRAVDGLTPATPEHPDWPLIQSVLHGFALRQAGDGIVSARQRMSAALDETPLQKLKVFDDGQYRAFSLENAEALHEMVTSAYALNSVERNILQYDLRFLGEWLEAHHILRRIQGCESDGAGLPSHQAILSLVEDMILHYRTFHVSVFDRKDALSLWSSLLGSRPDETSFCEMMSANLRSYRQLGEVAAPLLYSRRKLSAPLPGGAFHLTVVRGWAESRSGLLLGFYEGTPDEDQELVANQLAQVGMNLDLANGILRIVTIQGPGFSVFRSRLSRQWAAQGRPKPSKEEAQEVFEARNRAFQNAVPGCSGPDLLTALAVDLAKRWGLRKVEIVRDKAQQARLKTQHGAQGSFYDLFQLRFDGRFTNDADYGEIDLSGVDENYFARVLARSHRDRPKKWKNSEPNAENPQVRYFLDILRPLLKNLAWAKTDVDDGLFFDSRFVNPEDGPLGGSVDLTRVFRRD